MKAQPLALLALIVRQPESEFVFHAFKGEKKDKGASAHSKYQSRAVAGSLIAACVQLPHISLNLPAFFEEDWELIAAVYKDGQLILKREAIGSELRVVENGLFKNTSRQAVLEERSSERLLQRGIKKLKQLPFYDALF